MHTILSVWLAVAAVPEAPEKTHSFEVAASPQFYALFGGYHVSVHLTPAWLPRLRLTATSFAMTFPKLLLKENAAKGWELRHWSPLTVGANWFFLEGRGGPFAG